MSTSIRNFGTVAILFFSPTPADLNPENSSSRQRHSVSHAPSLRHLTLELRFQTARFVIAPQVPPTELRYPAKPFFCGRPLLDNVGGNSRSSPRESLSSPRACSHRDP